MAKALTTVISVEPDEQVIRFLSASGTSAGDIQFSSKPLRGNNFDQNFLSNFKLALNEYSQEKPSYMGKANQVTMILQDNCFVTDFVSVPTGKRQKMEEMLKISIEGKYKNYSDLQIKQCPLVTNKQYSTYSLLGIQKTYIQSLYASCSENNMFPSILTYAGNATVDAVLAANSKLKSETFVFADIKQNSTRLCYVIKGLCLGSYTLPFGEELLRRDEVEAENMLFDHPVAELAVLNAIEKAKAKQLTMMGGAEQNAESGEEDNSPFAGFGESAAPGEVQAVQVKTLPKKTPRSLPKFMQRPVPETPEALVYENFRYFQKYIFEFIRQNKKLTLLSNPQIILVSLPADLKYLIDMSNLPEEEHRYKFAHIDFSDKGADVRAHLEMYGALFASQFNKHNNF